MMNSKSLVVYILLCSFLSVASAQEWKPLFDGLSFDGWTKQNGSAVDEESAPAWEVADGMLHLDRSQGKGGNLLTDRDYGDFELLFEWKVAPAANNGIKYRVADFDGRVLGLEYQVIDDYGNPKLSANHKTASIYDIYDAKEHSVLQPADQWNRGRILVRNNRIEHWLNGQLISEAEVGSEVWNENLAKSKFADVPGFGTNALGKIMLTDHQDEVWYRNLFIREFTAAPVANPEAAACGPTLTIAQTCTPSVTSQTYYCQPTVRRRGFFRRLRR